MRKELEFRMFWSLVLLSAFRYGVESVALFFRLRAKSDWSMWMICENSLESSFRKISSLWLEIKISDDLSCDT